MTSDRHFLPYGRQSLTEADVTAVVDVLRSDYWTTGPAVPAFEAKFSESCNGAEAVAVSNGTTALHLASHCAGVTEHSLVVVPDITFVATANGARYLGAEVLLSDVDPGTGLMGPAQLRAALDAARRPVQCVFVVHLAGQTADLHALRSVCDDHPNGKAARLIEDACHAVGTIGQDGLPVGACAISDFATFSFHPVKTVAAGEGGMITCKSPETAKHLRLLRSHGITRDPAQFQHAKEATSACGGPNPWYYEAIELGFNYRLTDIQAALGTSQLSRLPEFKTKRQALIAHYTKRLAEASNSVRTCLSMVERVEGCDPCWHLCVVHVDFDRLTIDKAALMDALRTQSIGTQVHYVPLHQHPALAEGQIPAVHRAGQLDGATRYYARSLSLPLFQDMSISDVDYVCDVLIDMIEAALE